MGDKDSMKGAPKEKNELKDAMKGGVKQGEEKKPTPPGQKK